MDMDDILPIVFLGLCLFMLVIMGLLCTDAYLNYKKCEMFSCSKKYIELDIGGLK
jgi:hypothetical protein